MAHKKTKPTTENLPGLPTPFYLAQEVGKGLGQCNLLF